MKPFTFYPMHWWPRYVWAGRYRTISRYQQGEWHFRHCAQLLTRLRSGELTSACLNNLCQSVWAAAHMRWPFEKRQHYLQRQVAGGRGLETTLLTQPWPNATLARYTIRTGVDLQALGQLALQRPEPFKEDLARYRQNDAPDLPRPVQSIQVDIPVAPSGMPKQKPTAEDIIREMGSKWDLMPGWLEPEIEAAYRFDAQHDLLEQVYLLFWRDDKGTLKYRALVNGDSAAQKADVLKRSEAFWQETWRTLQRWRNPPTWEESVAFVNRSFHPI